MLNFPGTNDIVLDTAIDGTPDGEYALRILRGYRQRCNVRWQVEGLPPERAALWEQMNRDQEQRAVELDAAIALLEERVN